MTKIISISDEAYNELKKIKNGMSFSKIIIKLTGEKKNIMEFAGTWDSIEGERIKKEIIKEREIKSRRFL
ncbi:antitoxin VapB family protein [Candidatus Pacearchaeota archaeon]|nr:antitoxin VapB family protein [Candidatus Pacearchaeota archaeon]